MCSGALIVACGAAIAVMLFDPLLLHPLRPTVTPSWMSVVDGVKFSVGPLAP